jgi:hypothetical protein
MKSIIALSLAAFTAGCMAEAPAEPSAEARTRLAEELGERVAGTSVSCVNSRDLHSNRTIGEEVILFDGPGNTIYVNRPAAGCPGMNSGRAMRTRTPSTRLCRGDIVTVFDPVSGIEYGSCGLGDFTPFRRVG